jgi:hypothetical protein
MSSVRATLDQYAKLMEEAKIRLHALQNTTTGATGLAHPLAREFCFLQIRMLFELIALGCLVAHGDIRTRRSETTYQADLIIKELGALHEDFYPHPAIMISKPRQCGPRASSVCGLSPS